MFLQIFSCWAVSLDGTSRRNVIGGHAIAEYSEHAGIANIADCAGLQCHSIEIRSALDIGRVPIPDVGVAFWNIEGSPARISGINFAVGLAEHIGGDRVPHRLIHFML